MESKEKIITDSIDLRLESKEKAIKTAIEKRDMAIKKMSHSIALINSQVNSNKQKEFKILLKALTNSGDKHE